MSLTANAISDKILISRIKDGRYSNLERMARNE
jgi:hypothetical protein